MTQDPWPQLRHIEGQPMSFVQRLDDPDEQLPTVLVPDGPAAPLQLPPLLTEDDE